MFEKLVCVACPVSHVLLHACLAVSLHLKQRLQTSRIYFSNKEMPHSETPLCKQLIGFHDRKTGKAHW